MDAGSLQRMAVFGIGMMAGGVAYASAAGGLCVPGYSQTECWQTASAEPAIPPASDLLPAESKKPESARPALQPAPEPRTTEEATKRAADPKDPSGALIVAPPAAGKAKVNP